MNSAQRFSQIVLYLTATLTDDFKLHALYPIHNIIKPFMSSSYLMYKIIIDFISEKYFLTIFALLNGTGKDYSYSVCFDIDVSCKCIYRV